MAETKLSFKDKRWSLHGMTALVTGGTRGIGHAIVEELAEFGAAVHICARNQEDINKCLEEWKSRGFSVTGTACDVSSREQRENLMKTVASIFHGKLNILVNNAGTCPSKTITDHTAEDITTTMGTNFESSYHLCQLAHPLLKASGYGSIVLISSVAGSKAYPLCSVYAASKGAINQITKNLALEWAKDNIRANVVAPGSVMTLLLESIMKPMGLVVDNLVSKTPVGRIGEPKDISPLVAFLCLPAASYITGQREYLPQLLYGISAGLRVPIRRLLLLLQKADLRVHKSLPRFLLNPKGGPGKRFQSAAAPEKRLWVGLLLPTSSLKTTSRP